MTFILNILYAISRFFGWLFHFFYNSRVGYFCYRMRREFATQLYKRDFKHFGEHSFIDKPALIQSPKRISIGSGSSINVGVFLRCYGNNSTIEIGNGVSIGVQNSITSCNRIVIGDGVTTGRMVLITDNSHGKNNSLDDLKLRPMDREVVSKGEVIIEDNVWLGEMVCVMPGVTIGHGSVIGANAVVTKDIPPYSIAVGCPAKVVKTIEK